MISISSELLRRSDPTVVERFITQADAVVHTLRLIVLDRHVRELLRHAGYVLIDWQPQPQPQRWPDLLAYGEGPMARPGARGTYWIAVRVAIRADSQLYVQTRRRLASERWRAEVPGGREATPLIVVPDASTVDLSARDGIEGVRASELLARVRRG